MQRCKLVAESVTVLAKAGGQEEEWRCFQRWGGGVCGGSRVVLAIQIGGGEKNRWCGGRGNASKVGGTDCKSV